MADPGLACRVGLRADDPWLETLTGLGPADVALDLDPELLIRLEIAEQDAAELIEHRTEIVTDEQLCWLLRAECHRMIAVMGKFGSVPAAPHLAPELGAAGRYFYAYVFLALVPQVRAYHARRGVPEDVSWATLADIGEKLALHRRAFGVGGLRTQFWFTLHERGVLYRLGRLQFAFEESEEGDGSTVLGIHIPEWGGPMTPAACDASLEAARAFFAAHLPEHAVRTGTCGSWLLDPQLAEYLAATSNIVALQRRFALTEQRPDEEIIDGRTRGDRAVLEFVFRSPGTALDQLPQRSTLERAVVAHLRAGRHWTQRFGTLALP